MREEGEKRENIDLGNTPPSKLSGDDCRNFVGRKGDRHQAVPSVRPILPE